MTNAINYTQRLNPDSLNYSAMLLQLDPSGTPPTAPKEHAYFRVLRVLELQPAIPQRALAKQLDISMGKANYLINALLEKGLIKIESFQRSVSNQNRNAEEFIGTRKLRNLLVHEYMTESRLFHEALITAKAATEMLFRVVAAIKAEAISRGLIVSG